MSFATSGKYFIILQLLCNFFHALALGAQVDGKYIPENAERTQAEIAAIDDFRTTCTELGDSGCKLLLVGFGEEGDDLDDPYEISGFGMFQSVNGQRNCMFLRATDIWDAGILQHLFAMFGFSDSDSMEIPVEDGVIRFKLPQDYYKVNLCINKKDPRKESVPLAPSQFEITRNVEPYGQTGKSTFHVTEYDSFIFLSMDLPEAGSYTITLPDELENIYEIARKVNLEIPSLRLTLSGDGINRTNPYLVEVHRSTIYNLCVDFGNPEISSEDILACWYTLEKNTVGEIQDSGTTEQSSEVKITLGEMDSGLYTGGIEFPALGAYQLQVYATGLDGRKVVSNVISIAVVEAIPIPDNIVDVTKHVREKISISPSVLCPKIAGVDNLQQITYRNL